jgi:hypothetical protein
MQSKSWRYHLVSLAVLVLGLLSGCANTLGVKVTRFNQWPADAAGATYRFTKPEPQSSLELQAYQSQVGAALQVLGLRPPTAGETARFTVDVQAELSEKQRKRLVPVYSDQWTYVPPWRDAQGRWFGGHWIPDPLGSRYVGERTVVQTVQHSRLKLRITESARARTVFEATAVHEGSEDDLVEVVPYLVSGVFQDFPGANGQVRRLNFELPAR